LVTIAGEALDGLIGKAQKCVAAYHDDGGGRAKDLLVAKYSG